MNFLISYTSAKQTNNPPAPFTVFVIELNGNSVLLVTQAQKSGVIINSFLSLIFYIRSSPKYYSDFKLELESDHFTYLQC